MAKKFLIVDDNEVNLYLLQALLAGKGYGVTAARNGREALAAARSDPPDMIISDILMPVMDGYTLCRQWKADERLKAVPFVFYTATYTDPKDEQFALSLGAERFIIKPMEPEALLAVVDEVFSGAGALPNKPGPPLGEDMEFFRRHNETLFRKLEKKVSDLEIANQKLKILEEKYRLSFENIRDVIFVISADLMVTDISPSAERLMGYRPEEIVGRPVTDLKGILTPESFLLATEQIRLILRGEPTPTSVYRFIAKDGTIRHGETSGGPIRREGRIIGMISVARDISDRLRTEEALRESEKKYRELYDFLPIPVYEMDLEANLTAANRAIFETFRGSEKDIEKGFKVWDLLAPEAVETSKENIQRLIRGETVGGTEYNLRRMDGTVFPAIVISSVIRREGRPVGLRGAIVDITARRKAEEKLQQTLASLNRAVSTTIRVMVAAVEARDPYTSGHQFRSADLARAIAEEMGLPRDRIDGIRVAASIHDIGKISIPAEILSKPSRLTELEFAMIQEHSRTGYEILKDVESAWPLAEIVRQHHERMDGSGYPRKLAGDAILIEARIIGVADVVEAMASHRPYRPSLGIEAALKEIVRRRGIAYDRDVVDACVRLFREKGYRLPVNP